jgi:hypothetical protein
VGPKAVLDTVVKIKIASPCRQSNPRTPIVQPVAHCCTDKRNEYKILVGKPEGKRPLARPRRRWEDNIRMDLRAVGCEDVEWIYLAQDRDQWRALLNAAMKLRVP